MFFSIVGLCQGCVRYHPKASGNCEIAKEWIELQKKYECKIMLTSCPNFLSPTEAFPEPTAGDPNHACADTSCDGIHPLMCGGGME